MPKDKRELKMLDPDKVLQLRNRFRIQALQNLDIEKLVKEDYSEIFEQQANSFYEEIGSVGYQPQTERLEAVIYVNQPNGYGGSLCGPGTQEYVRFFASFDNGTSWDDLGVASLTVWDVPEGTEGIKRIEYAVTLPQTFEKWICKRPHGPHPRDTLMECHPAGGRRQACPRLG